MKLELFHKMSCPYSARVRDFIEANGLKDRVRYRNILDDDEAYSDLMRLRGDLQVPCLLIDGKPMLESEEIVDWLRKNLVQGKRQRQAA